MTEQDLLLGIVAAVNDVLDANLIPPNPQAKRALEELRAKRDNYRNYQLHCNENERPHVRSKICERCHTPFFFARIGGPVSPDDSVFAKPKPGVPWVPFELDPVAAEGVLAQWKWVVDFHGPQPVAHCSPTLATGDVWVDHRQTCGAGDGPKHRCLPYLRRYQVNIERASADLHVAVADLRALNDSLGSE